MCVYKRNKVSAGFYLFYPDAVRAAYGFGCMESQTIALLAYGWDKRFEPFFQVSFRFYRLILRLGANSQVPALCLFHSQGIMPGYLRMVCFFHRLDIQKDRSPEAKFFKHRAGIEQILASAGKGNQHRLFRQGFVTIIKIQYIFKPYADIAAGFKHLHLVNKIRLCYRAAFGSVSYERIVQDE